MRIVLDTNIYLSALIFPESIPAKILSLAKTNKYELYISEFILSEIQNILIVKFDYKLEVAQKIIDEILKYAKLISVKDHINIIKAKKDDNHILECAISARAHFLITGDKKHILIIKKINKTKIISPAEFFKNFKTRNRGDFG